MDTNKNIFDLTPTVDISDIDNIPRDDSIDNPVVQDEVSFTSNLIVDINKSNWYDESLPYPNYKVTDGVFFTRWDNKSYPEKPNIREMGLITNTIASSKSEFFISNEEFVRRIENGQAMITNYIENEDSLSKGNYEWKLSYLIPLDFDKVDIHPKEMVKIMAEHNIHIYVANYSYSYMESKKEYDEAISRGEEVTEPLYSYHMFIRPASPIHNDSIYTILLDRLIKKTGGDTACKDLVRRWFSSVENSVCYTNFNAITTIDSLLTYAFYDSVNTRTSFSINNLYCFDEIGNIKDGRFDCLVTLYPNGKQFRMPFSCKKRTLTIVIYYSECSNLSRFCDPNSKPAIKEDIFKILEFLSTDGLITHSESEENEMYIGENGLFIITNLKTEAKRTFTKRVNKDSKEPGNINQNNSKLVNKARRLALSDVEERLISNCMLYSDFINGDNIKHTGMVHLLSSLQHFKNKKETLEKIHNSNLSTDNKQKAEYFINQNYQYPYPCRNSSCKYYGNKCNAGKYTSILSRCMESSKKRISFPDIIEEKPVIKEARNINKKTLAAIYRNEEGNHVVYSMTSSGKTYAAMQEFISYTGESILIYSVPTHQLIQSLSDKYGLYDMEDVIVQLERPDINYSPSDLVALELSDSNVNKYEPISMWRRISKGKTLEEINVINEYCNNIRNILSLKKRKIVCTHKMALNIIELNANKQFMYTWDEDLIPSLQETMKIRISDLDSLEVYLKNDEKMMKWINILKNIQNYPTIIPHSQYVEDRIKEICIADVSKVKFWFFAQRDRYAINTGNDFILGMYHRRIPMIEGNTNIILTATPYIPHYEHIFPDLKVHELTTAVNIDIYIDDTYTLSGSSLEGLEARHGSDFLFKYILQKYSMYNLDGIILPKRYTYIERGKKYLGRPSDTQELKDSLKHINVLYTFGDDQGFDAPDWVHKMGVFGTPWAPSEITPLTFASIYRKELTEEDVITSEQMIEWKGYKYSSFTYNNPKLRDYHQHTVRSTLQQSAGRPRNGESYLFCGVPVYGAKPLSV